jgi:hypothetical protein
VKSRKYRGFLAKARDLAGLTGIDLGWLDLDPLVRVLQINPMVH